ncbi:uncharacterized protein LOC114406253 [Glycine soja]|uniref:RING-CH-type domain-containing protein n=1 Tax=Glycine soja TaxID=3848 RepID=A0A0B2RKX4_GLYSO|nr:uncharacterized protein LOC114406253 [Glycine soja]KAG5042612.1 hypothetical protein JHK87_006527 [Glycine soja]KHN32517.1 hypothetical protein glysoja_042593 [Glycine soja]RZC19573.1 hypothetical protein D0Y65_006415 [Glycine soja]
MSSLQMCHVVDLEQGSLSHHHRSVSGSDMSMCFSDAENGSCYSHFYSTNGDPYDDYTFGCVSDAEDGGDVDLRRASSVTDSVEVEIESGAPEIKVHLAKVERDCRICHLGLESDDSQEESGVPIELGCSCKDDLGAAHKNCAEAWFKIKGNRTCEICHSVARNVCGANEETTHTLSDSSNANNAASTISTSTEPRRFWQGHRFLNFLLACIVFAFVISWLFHFNMPSS